MKYMHGYDVSFGEAINTLTEICATVRNTKVSLSYNGFDFECVAMNGGIPPKVHVPVSGVRDFSDDVLIDEYFRRIETSEDFRNTLDARVTATLSVIFN